MTKDELKALNKRLAKKSKRQLLKIADTMEAHGLLCMCKTCLVLED